MYMLPDIFLKASMSFVTFVHRLIEHMYDNKVSFLSMMKLISSDICEQNKQ